MKQELRLSGTGGQGLILAGIIWLKQHSSTANLLSNPNPMVRKHAVVPPNPK